MRHNLTPKAKTILRGALADYLGKPEWDSHDRELIGMLLEALDSPEVRIVIEKVKV